MDYKEKLIKFNSTEKYKREVELVFKLINPTPDTRILDYGCGTGWASFLNGADGYDTNDYNKYLNQKDYYLNNLPVHKEYTDIYFLHSFAHVKNIKERLSILKSMYSARLTVITPNASWLALQTNQGYTPDPTVVKHYTQKELKELFESCGYEVTLIGQFGESMNGINERIFLQAI